MEKQKQIEIRDLRIKVISDEAIRLGVDLKESREENSRFYRNPWIMGGIGLLAGTILWR